MTDSMTATFLLLAYNQEKFIAEAVAGALAQTYAPMEIILSDDCSTDNTFGIMQRLAAEYTGPHRVVVRQNEQNLGLVQHFNRVMELATGDVVLLAAGDDVSLPGRTTESMRLLYNHPWAMGLSVRLQVIDSQGALLPSESDNEVQVGFATYGIEDYLRNPSFHLNGASRAFRKQVYSQFGPLDNGCRTEDSTMLLRCLMVGEVIQSGEIGVLYRRHGGNISAPERIHLLKVGDICRQYRSDVAKAFRMGLVPRELHRRIMWRIGKYQAVRMFRQIKFRLKRQITNW